MVISASQTDNELDSRFSELLKPIRDLTKNWDVDIASYLEDYLEELDKITITFDGGSTTMNFAQAAMLIQGSACVYSKKVEYLYSLVYQVLDLIANKKKQGKSSVDEDGNDEDANFENKNKDEEFLSLDDIKEHKNIGLKEDDITMDKSIYPIPQMPLSLIPLEEGEKGDNPLLSKLGEVLASRNDFKLNTCSVHTSGALLLDMSYLKLLEQSLKYMSTSVPCQKIPEIHTSIESIPEENLDDVNNFSVPKDGLPQDVSGDDNDGDCDMPAEDIEVPPPSNNTQNENQMETDETIAIRKSERKTKRVQIVAPKPFVNAWEPTDPHEAGNTSEKPFKRGKIFMIPDCCENETNTKKRKRKQYKKVKELSPLASFIFEKYSHKSKFSKNPLKVTEFPEFERLYWKVFKQRQAAMRNERKQANTQWVEEDDEENQEEFHHQQLLSAGGIENDIGVDYDDGDDAPALVDDRLFDAIDSALDNHGSILNAGDDIGFLDVSKGEVITSYEELVREHVDAYLASAMEYAQITELSRRVSEWEDRVIPKLQEEDKHETFDINKYGSRILDKLEKKQSIPFKKLVTGKPEFEICRQFLAMLMLANTLNVRIISKACLEDGMDKVELELLTTKRHFEELEEYQAPSIVKV